MKYTIVAVRPTDGVTFTKAIERGRREHHATPIKRAKALVKRLRKQGFQVQRGSDVLQGPAGRSRVSDP